VAQFSPEGWLNFTGIIRQKIEGRGYQSFDKGDILGELGRLQQTVGTLNSEMLKIHDLLKQQS
jgi:hypothetical protein